MSVTQSSTPGTEYTWATATWSWDDIRAQKTWATAYGTNFQCTESIAGPNVADARRSAVDERQSSVFATASNRRAVVTERSSSAFATAEARADVWAAIRNFAEAAAFAEARHSAVTDRSFSTLGFGEARSDVWAAARTFATSISLAESYADFANWIQANGSALLFAEVRSSAATRRALAEAFSVVESGRVSAIGSFDPEAFSTATLRASAVTERQAENFAVADAYADVVAFARNIAETWTTIESRSVAAVTQRAEVAAFAEARTDAWTATRSFASAVAFAEARADVVAFFRNAQGTLTIAEARRSTVAKSLAEFVALVEAATDLVAFTRSWVSPLDFAEASPTGIAKAFSSAWQTSEARADVWTAVRSWATAISWTSSYIDNIAWIQANAETLALLSAARRDIGNQNPEALSLAEARRSIITNIERETLALSETYADIIAWIQANLENLNFSEFRPTAIAKDIRRSLAVRDMLLRNATGVFGDVTVRNSAMTLEMFAEFAAGRPPVGFEPFKPFLPGDYLFQTAIINAATVPADGMNETVSIQALQTTTDVQDLSDRGTESIPAGGKTISFGQAFTVVPEVVAQQTGGLVTAIPVVSAVTASSFFVRLFDAANPATGVAGTISWSATGY